MREGMVTPCRPRSHYRCRVSVLAAISFGLGGLLGVAPHYRRRCLRLADARTLLILAVRFGAGRVLRGCVLRFDSGCASQTGSGCVLRTGGGCVLRTASASISSSSALVFVLSLIDHLRDR